MSEFIKISLDDKPNLAKLKEKDITSFREIMSTFMKLAEESASTQRAIPWYTLPHQLHENLTFANMVPALMDAFFSVDKINADSFSIVGLGVHPLSLLKQSKLGNVGYSTWRNHFGLRNQGPVTPEVVTEIVRQLLYYARYIDMESFGKALMSNELEAHKAIPSLNAERLPFVPALRYQQEVFGDLFVGKFWSDIGAFHGGEYEEIPMDCPACHLNDLALIGEYHVCRSCNLGVKVVMPED